MWNLTFILSSSHEKFSLVLILITSLALEKCKKKNAICFKLFWYKVFVHWKLKLLNFLVDPVLRFRWALNLLISYRLEKSLLQTAKGRSALRHREKQRAKPEIDCKIGLVSEFYKNAKIVSKSSKHGKTLKQF